MPSLTAVSSPIMNSDSVLKIKSAVSKLKVAALPSNGIFTLNNSDVQLHGLFASDTNTLNIPTEPQIT